MNARGSTEPQEQPPPRRAEAIDPSKLTIRQIRESMTLGQIYGVIAITIAVLAFVATSSYKLGAYLSSPPADTRGAESSIAPATMVPIQPDTIIATHYPTGELFAVDPKSGTLRVISVRLGNPLGLAIRPNGEIIVLESDLKGYKHPRSGDNLYPTGIRGVKPETGYHRFIASSLLPYQPRALALESENSVLVALDGALIRVDLESGETMFVASGDLLRGASGTEYIEERLGKNLARSARNSFFSVL